VLAAKLAGIHTVIVPKLNQRDLTEVPETIKKGLGFHFVEHMDEVLELALLAVPDVAPQVPAAAERPAEVPAAAH
jgi:ATP-dependent Lon protease